MQVTIRQQKLKKQAIDYKGSQCLSCGYNKYQGALEFHHLDPLTKDFNISRVKHTHFEKIKNELDKCILLCSNCHKEIHKGLIGYDSKTNSIFQKEIDTEEKWISTSFIVNKLDLTEIKSRLINKESVSNIAQEYNITKNYLLQILTKNDIYISKMEEQKTIKYKIVWPSIEEMSKLIWEYPASQLSKKLGVSDVSINKFCKKHNIEKPPKGYWLKNI